jgi:hypothetical protein
MVIASSNQRILELEAMVAAKQQELIDLQQKCSEYEPKIAKLMAENDMLMKTVKETASDIQVLQEKYVELQEPLNVQARQEHGDRPLVNVREEVIERPLIVEVPVPIEVEQQIDVPVQEIIEQPVIYEQIIERPIPVEREVIIEQIVERPIIREILIENPVEVPVVRPVFIEEPVPTPVERPVVVEVVTTIHQDVLVEPIPLMPNMVSPQAMLNSPARITASPLGLPSIVSQHIGSPSPLAYRDVAPVVRSPPIFYGFQQSPFQQSPFIDNRGAFGMTPPRPF